MTAVIAQDIEVGPVRVDTGNDWLDFGFVVVLLILVAVIAAVLRRKKP